MNRLHFLAPVFRTIYISGIKISGADKNVVESDVEFEFAEVAAIIIAGIVKGKLKTNKS